jgi:O-antigen/teichoic acid export membrane protein
MRSSALTVFGYGGQQVIRLASNLILTRLLFPEAFGMMALVYVFMQGLNNFSDVGITPSIMQSKRGDDPAFLNTAWTMQVARGFMLWLLTIGLAWPAAQFYDAPQLAQLLPAVGLTLVISGFNPTRLDTASRHLNLGRVTAIEFASQIVSLIVAVLLAWLTGSVWALVISGIVSSFVHMLLLTLYLPGERNRFQWEAKASRELISFGKWIFLSTVVGFFLSQGDKIVLGKYLSLETLGIYNIGFFLASFPMLMGGMVIRRILIPIYRERPPKDSPDNFRKLQKMRFVVSAALMGMLFVLAISGNWLIQVLYDPRYQLAGGILVVIACAQVPHLIALTYDQAALAAGDSRRFFVLAAARATFVMAALIIGVEHFGLIGALVGQGMAMLLVYPVVVWLARHQGTWDPLHDGAFAALGALLIACALFVNMPAVQAVIALNSP